MRPPSRFWRKQVRIELTRAAEAPAAVLKTVGATGPQLLPYGGGPAGDLQESIIAE